MRTTKVARQAQEVQQHWGLALALLQGQKAPRQAQEVQQHWGLALALLQGRKAPSRANSQAELQAWLARARGLEDA